ncbi:S1C family serine protease [bacterium]|nr:S1C family serine protease [bacterium]
MKSKLLAIVIFILSNASIFGQTATEVAIIGINSTVSVIALDNIKQPLAYGSGFILEDGLVVTNVHVIEDSKSAYILMNDNSEKFYVSGYVAIDKENDLVILKAEGVTGKPLKLASDELPEIGGRIYAIGNPKGLSGTFSEGIISGIREIENNDVIQITAPISPGSSGGPVLNSKSEVVGIAFAGYSDGQNLNFAIPVKYLKKLSNIVGVTKLLSDIVPKTKTVSTQAIESNIKEGVTVRNITTDLIGNIRFSIKNNLGYKVTDIKILFLIYDYTDTIVDYVEKTLKPQNGIKPYLAIYYGILSPIHTQVESVSSVKARVLDYKIIEE